MTTARRPCRRDGVRRDDRRQPEAAHPGRRPEDRAAYGKTYAKAADERIQEKDFELQRAGDLVAELRRQMNVLERHSDKYALIAKAVQAARRDGAQAIDISYLLDIINAPAKQTDPGADQASAAESSTRRI